MHKPSHTHTHRPPRCNCAPLIFSFATQSKFIIGDKGLLLPFPLKRKNLYWSKIRQSPRCNESEPWGIWAPQWEGRRRYDPELMWKTGPPEKSQEGSDNDQWIKQEPYRGRHGGWWDSKPSKTHRLRSQRTSFSKVLFRPSLLTLRCLYIYKTWMLKGQFNPNSIFHIFPLICLSRVLEMSAVTKKKKFHFGTVFLVQKEECIYSQMRGEILLIHSWGGCH